MPAGDRYASLSAFGATGPYRDRHLRIYSLACVGCPRNIHCGFGRTEIAQSRDPLPALLARQSCHQIHVSRLVKLLIKQGLHCRSAALDKVRHYVRYAGRLFEIDEFLGDNGGLVVAEIELVHADEAFAKPTWLGDEVTDDARYYNVNLVRTPYRRWT